jgi:hypothetical protein
MVRLAWSGTMMLVMTRRRPETDEQQQTSPFSMDRRPRKRRRTSPTRSPLAISDIRCGLDEASPKQSRESRFIRAGRMRELVGDKAIRDSPCSALAVISRIR